MEVNNYTIVINNPLYTKLSPFKSFVLATHLLRISILFTGDKAIKKCNNMPGNSHTSVAK